MDSTWRVRGLTSPGWLWIIQISEILKIFLKMQFLVLISKSQNLNAQCFDFHFLSWMTKKFSWLQKWNTNNEAKSGRRRFCGMWLFYCLLLFVFCWFNFLSFEKEKENQGVISTFLFKSGFCIYKPKRDQPASFHVSVFISKVIKKWPRDTPGLVSGWMWGSRWKQPVWRTEEQLTLLMNHPWIKISKLAFSQLVCRMKCKRSSLELERLWREPHSPTAGSQIWIRMSCFTTRHTLIWTNLDEVQHSRRQPEQSPHRNVPSERRTCDGTLVFLDFTEGFMCCTRKQWRTIFLTDLCSRENPTAIQMEDCSTNVWDQCSRENPPIEMGTVV